MTWDNVGYNKMPMEHLNQKLPKVHGKYRNNVDLSTINWFRTGGIAKTVFKPSGSDDLQFFLQNKSLDTQYNIIGVGSNILVSDEQITEIVIKLGNGFNHLAIHGNYLDVGSAVLDSTIAQIAISEGYENLAFMCGIPGTIGGALRMNSGCYDGETSDILSVAFVMDEKGKIHQLTPEDLGLTYRHCALPKNWIFIGARFKLNKSTPQKVQQKVQEFIKQREATQPIRTKTGGSTFANPPGHKAWELIAQSDCLGLQIGGAKISSQHCNFIINTGNANSNDIFQLGELVRKKVLEKTGIKLMWEIQKIGSFKNNHFLQKIA